MTWTLTGVYTPTDANPLTERYGQPETVVFETREALEAALPWYPYAHIGLGEGD